VVTQQTQRSATLATQWNRSPVYPRSSDHNPEATAFKPHTTIECDEERIAAMETAGTFFSTQRAAATAYAMQLMKRLQTAKPDAQEHK
jgi:hypothetical protein